MLWLGERLTLRQWELVVSLGIALISCAIQFSGRTATPFVLFYLWSNIFAWYFFPRTRALIQFLLGVDAPVSLLLLQQIFITVLVNTLIALPVYALVRRIIQPVLPQDPRRRRRRAYTTGGLSPLQRPSDRLGPIPRSSSR